MPLLFSYGTLQDEKVQIATFGRRLTGQRDALVGFELSSVAIDDPAIATRLGRSHHANARLSRSMDAPLAGMAFDVTDEELAKTDEYEAEFAYERIVAKLASNREAWVYVYAPARQ